MSASRSAWLPPLMLTWLVGCSAPPPPEVKLPEVPSTDAADPAPSPSSGGAEVTVDLELIPRLRALTSSQSRLDVGQRTVLSASATDARAEALDYTWSATCAGDFTGQGSATVGFTPSERPEAVCNNCQVSVGVSNSRGGRTTGRLALCVSAPLPPGATWSPTPDPMLHARATHTSTLLPDGHVLLAGGTREATAEVYDPYRETWSSTGPMAEAREFHTATLLPSGQVLIAGGAYYSSSATCELYDPATGTWRPTGSMSVPRDTHTATLLPDGRVLVAGGKDSTRSGLTRLATAELYDPATGTWSPTGSMSVPRDTAAAVLLPTGQVLVAGGDTYYGYGGLGTAELYDPATGTWSPTGPMVAAREWNTATLLPNGKVLVTGGPGSDNRLTMTELYDPATNTWSPTGSIAWPRIWHTVTLLSDGKVLLAGGGDYDSSRTMAELYDPATGLWSRTGGLSRERLSHAATRLLTGQVLLSGGETSGDSAEPAELYTP